MLSDSRRKFKLRDREENCELILDIFHDFSLDLFAYTSAVKSGIEIKRIPVYFPARKAGIGSNDTLKKKFFFSIRTLKFSLTMRKFFREAQKKSHA